MEAKGQSIGYVRVSSSSQNTFRQLSDLELDKVFTDTFSGETKDRPELTAMINYVREGDVVIVHSIDRLARNLYELHNIINALINKGVSVQFKKENLNFNAFNKADPISILLLNVLGAVAQFERDMIKERQAEGIATAKAKGVYKGRKPALTTKQIEKLNEAVKLGTTKKKVAEMLGVSIPTVYRFINN